MSMTSTLVANLVGYAIAYVIGAVVMGTHRSWWLRRAHKLAAQSDIALPGPLAGRVARFLRNESLFGQLVNVAAVPLVLTALRGGEEHQDWAAWFPWVLAGLPLYSIVVLFAFTVWPRWKASSGHRVTHLGSLRVRQAFTSAEYTTVAFGTVLSAALGAWGLRYVAAPALWWLAWAATMAVTFAAWRYAATNLMNRPSSASDWIELGWDDLLRFRRVRGFTAATAWGTALYLYLVDCLMSSAFVEKTTTPNEVSYQLNWWPVIAPVVVGFLLAWVFRQGRQLWRRAWLEGHAGG
jgi:hypothetical protein